MKKWIVITVLSITGFSQISFAGTTADAKQALAQNTTNGFCPLGAQTNPFEQTAKYQNDMYKNGCPAGMSYVECLKTSTYK